MRRPTPTLLALVAVAAMTVTACGDDADDGAGSSNGERPTSTDPDESSTVPEASNRCPDSDPPRGTETAGSTTLDADGDGIDDRASVRIVDDVTLELVVDYGAGGRTVATYDDEAVLTVAAVRVDRVADVDGDGDDDLWVVLGSGASVEVIGLVVAEGCGLVRPIGPAGPNAYPVGASVGSVSGIECVDTDGDGRFDGFAEHVGERRDDHYDGTSTTWRIGPGGEMVRRNAVEPFSVVEDDPDLTRLGRLVCP